MCGVPHRSVLGPLLFNLYMLPLAQIIQNNNINHHSYADDTQIYIALESYDNSSIDSLCHCIENINTWMNQNCLQLNQGKTEIIVFGNKNYRTSIIKELDSRAQKTREQVRNLGVLIDSDLTFNSHI